MVVWIGVRDVGTVVIFTKLCNSISHAEDFDIILIDELNGSCASDEVFLRVYTYL